MSYHSVCAESRPHHCLGNWRFGRSYLDSNGERIGDPDSVQFIEASWVEKPAFKGAVINHFVSEIPKRAALLSMQSAQLQSVVDDIFKLRVADTTGMMVLRLAREETLRRKRRVMMTRVVSNLMKQPST